MHRVNLFSMSFNHCGNSKQRASCTFTSYIKDEVPKNYVPHDAKLSKVNKI